MKEGEFYIGNRILLRINKLKLKITFMYYIILYYFIKLNDKRDDGIMCPASFRTYVEYERGY